ncbi:solute carrier organic anion transporter family member 2A1-like [Amphiura filiformis]|uniref:solute carrier organic anion transporter family member 2A1-like n=1 Tax=Amphiura filiformis TaxID=82378 RepID=UPI003B2219D8
MAENKCGCGPCKPSWLQKLANPKLFVLNITIIRLFISSTYINAALTILERQFKLSSTESGALASVNDVAIICVVIFASYFGHKSHRPRWIAVGCIATVIGNFLCTLPHYLSEPTDTADILTNDKKASAELLSKFLCLSDDRDLVTKNETSEFCQVERGVATSVIWVVIGQIFIGAGSGFIFPITVTYVEDAVGKSKTLSYLAFVYIGNLGGAVIGFLVSSFTNSLYVDFDRLKPEDIPNIPQNDTRWVGAWWLGFVINGILLLVFTIPMFFFPRIMKTNEKEDTNELTEVKEGTSKLQQATKLTDIFRESEEKGLTEVARGKFVTSSEASWFQCDFMVFSHLGSCLSAIGGGGLANIPKFLVYQFNLSVSTANLVLAATFPLSMMSHFLSALLMRKLKHDSEKAFSFVVVLKVLGAIIIAGCLFVKCATPDIAGYTVSYQERTSMADSSECYADCSCQDQDFFPVCGADGITYTSPCVAGCTSSNISFGIDGQQAVYNDCSCVSEVESSSFSATPGFCESETCYNMVILCLALIVMAVFTTSLVVQPITYIVLRICDDDDRPVALGLLSVVQKIIGIIPAPIYFGAIINTTCQLWKTTCGERGNCLIYDMDKYRLYLFGLLTGLFALSAVAAAFARFTLRSALQSSIKKQPIQEDTENADAEKYTNNNPAL